LYAAPGLGDPNFAEAVVLLVRHGSEGGMGLIINRPTEAMAKEALPEAALAGLRVYRGGPVERDGILALLRGSRPPPAAERVLDGVFLVRPADLAGRGSAVDRDRVRIYSGYAGWGAGQLEKEIRLGGWVVGPADADALFTREPQALWRKVFQLLQRRQAFARPDRGPRSRASVELQREVAGDAAKVGVAGQESAPVADRGGRNLSVDTRDRESLGPALVADFRREDEVTAVKRQQWKWRERLHQPPRSVGTREALKHFLQDCADQADASALDRRSERLDLARGLRLVASQRERPHRGVDQDVHARSRSFL
jgi:putative transcriptional regulator